MIVSVDEVGFGSRKQYKRTYGNNYFFFSILLAYAPIGEPALLDIGKSLSHNMTFTVSLSTNGVELI